MTDILIEGGQSLIRGELVEAPLAVAAGKIVDAGAGRGASSRIDARGLLVLPGIVDLHGDAFERQMMPRPGVDFPTDVALIDSDRQLIANGITTAFHGVTWSWEPGLRGSENAHALVDAVEALRPRLACDTRIHLRHETYNLDAEETIIGWIKAKRIDLLAYNDHMSLTVLNPAKPEKRVRMAERTGLSLEAFNSLVDRVAARAGEVPASIARLAAACQASQIPLLSHDDETPAARQGFRALGVRIAEFPVTEDTAREAAAAGEFIVLGAPNVVRGGSHTGLDRCDRHGAQGPLLDPRLGLLLSGHDPGRLPPRRRRRAAAAESLGADLGCACGRRRPERPRRACGRTARGHRPRRRGSRPASTDRRRHRRRKARSPHRGGSGLATGCARADRGGLNRVRCPAQPATPSIMCQQPTPRSIGSAPRWSATMRSGLRISSSRRRLLPRSLTGTN